MYYNITPMGRSFPSAWCPLTTLCPAGVGTGPWGSPSLGHVRSGHVGRVQGGRLPPWTPPGACHCMMESCSG